MLDCFGEAYRSGLGLAECDRTPKGGLQTVYIREEAIHDPRDQVSSIWSIPLSLEPDFSTWHRMAAQVPVIAFVFQVAGRMKGQKRIQLLRSLVRSHPPLVPTPARMWSRGYI